MEMGYQRWVLEDIFQRGIGMEFLLFLATEARHANNSGGYNVVTNGLD